MPRQCFVPQSQCQRFERMSCPRAIHDLRLPHRVASNRPPSEARPNYSTQTHVEIASSYRTTRAALILQNVLQYARGRDPSTGEESRRKPRPESPRLPTAKPAADTPRQRASPEPAAKGESPVPPGRVASTKGQISAGSSIDTPQPVVRRQMHTPGHHSTAEALSTVCGPRCHRQGWPIGLAFATKVVRARAVRRLPGGFAAKAGWRLTGSNPLWAEWFVPQPQYAANDSWGIPLPTPAQAASDTAVKRCAIDGPEWS
jgi:hypothetical protein